MPSPVTIYADEILASSFRSPGVIRSDFGLSSHEDDDGAESVLRLVLPIDVARTYAKALGTLVAEADEAMADAQHDAATPRNLTTVSLFAIALQSLADELGKLVRGNPDLAPRFDAIEQRVLRDARNSSTEGISIEDEADAMRAALGMLKGVFEQIRRGEAQDDDPDGAGPDA